MLPTHSEVLTENYSTSDIMLNLKLADFFTREAHLLDDRRFEEWLDHLADDIFYFAPARLNRPITKSSMSDFVPIEQGGHFAENKQTLTVRVKKIRLRNSWSEDPRTRTRLVITNTIAQPMEKAGEFRTVSNFQYYRSRLSRPTHVLVGKRVDQLREADTMLGFEVFRREIYFDHDVLHHGGITTFL